MKRRYLLFSLLLIISFACSKDDDPTPPDEPQGALQGIFIDSPVSGLKYETETHSGMTDENGKFDYEEGETVTFFVGDIKLGSAPASEEISPISIASTPDATIETPEVQNIAAFLQTLDEDGDPENGIQISGEVVNSLNISSIDFTQPIIQTLGEIAVDVFKETGKSLKVVFPEIAAVHLAQTLGIEFEPQNLFNLNFVTIFSNYFGPNTHINQWLHEFDGNGRLIKSSLYEKYPFRISNEFIFSNYQDNTVNFQMISYYYKRASEPQKQEFTATFNDDYIIQKFENNYTGYNPTPYTVIKKLTTKNFIENIENLDSDEVLVGSENFEYNSEDFLTKVLNYGPADNLLAEKDITYTEFGDVEKELTKRPDGTYFLYNYFYRADHTLESLEWEVVLSNSDTYVIQEFDENEMLLKDTTSQEFEDGITQKTIELYESGILISSEWIYNGVKKQYTTYKLDGSGGSYLSTMENYDENGNLISKTCYNIDGNEIECTT